MNVSRSTSVLEAMKRALGMAGSSISDQLQRPQQQGQRKVKKHRNQYSQRIISSLRKSNEYIAQNPYKKEMWAKTAFPCPTCNAKPGQHCTKPVTADPMNIHPSSKIGAYCDARPGREGGSKRSRKRRG